MIFHHKCGYQINQVNLNFVPANFVCSTGSVLLLESKVIIEKSRDEVSLMGQDTIENVS